MKKFLTSLVACMCIICMFSGCGKKKDDASASPTPSTTETEAPTGEPDATPSSGDATKPDNTPENTGGNTVTNAPNNQTKNPGNATAKPTNAPTVKPTEAGWKKPNPQKITSMQPFANGERVCFVGDSITQANHYIDYIIDYYNNNLKDRKVEFFNCGVSGGKAVFQNKLIYNDTLLYNPTTVVIMLGINDSRLNVYNPQAASDQAFINRTVASYKSEMTTRLCFMPKCKRLAPAKILPVRLTLCLTFTAAA